MGGAPFEAASLPGTRSGTPTNNYGGEGDNVEVEREGKGVYHMSSLLRESEVVAASNSEEEFDVEISNEVEVTNSNSLVESHVKVMGLGFITNMAEYMAAADVLVSKAGPGTIAEAASLSLPVMLTSFLPGQEEGNVDYVVQNEFGTFVSDSDPQGISDVVANWLTDEEKLKHLSANAHKCGAPDAAAEIVEAIGESALRWKNINDSKHATKS